MPLQEEGAEKDVVLLICDISGYTPFLLAHRESRMHAYVIITALMKAVLRNVKRPLQVAKLEGDALFLYVPWPRSAGENQETAKSLIQSLDRFFLAFHERLAELEESDICRCDACKGVDRLRLKVVLHSGVALFHRIGRFDELAGVDVILTHRLLKNSIDLPEYITFTEAAYNDLGVHAPQNALEGTEQYEDVGTVKTFTYAPPLRADMAMAVPKGRYRSVLYQAKNILIKIFWTRLMLLRLKRPPRFRNVEVVS